MAEYVDYRGERILGAYHWMPALETCLLTEIDRDEAFQSIIQLQQHLALVGTAVTLGIILLGGLLARGVTRPLHRLTEGVHAVSSGHLDHRIPVDTGDEIGELAAAFNQMAAGRRRSLGRRNHTPVPARLNQREHLPTANRPILGYHTGRRHNSA